ncbi:zinc finger CCCH domain-containing protein 17-like protein [Carex littledalei]|uniref:Zinc finger CCCH domain-containing protein 17-like protein n=1 Tax=Carex littledalei TaxID=544730 RepID=A0A833VLV0_9POAL|nr:zinc finger CCCH domain-containing protein 17-like protein [Carex littledalei]
MDIEADERRYGSKRIYQRLGPASGQPDRPSKVCFHWQAGRCNRHPCPFLHSELPATQGPSSSSKRAPQQNLVWQNPSTRGNGGGPNGGNQSKWGKGRHEENTRRLNGGVGTSQGEKVCKHFLLGTCTFGDRCRYLHSWSIGDGFSLITPLKGHQKVVSAIALPSGSDKLYSGSKDETVKVWDCQTGQCVATVSMGREVGCMISEEPWLFVGIPDSIKVWNTQTGAEMSLSGPTGQVYALVAANDMLFAGTQDGRILVWKFSAATNCFEPAASLLGHRLAVISLVVGGTKLYSGSMDHTIKVWDLTTLQCVQTLSDHTNVVMSLLCWDQFLLSCSLDNTVKIWFTSNKDQMEVTYTHNEDHGVIALCGMIDAQGKPVLMCSLNDNSMRLYDLPSFNERGRIFAKQEVRAMQAGPGIFFTGDGTGEIKVWQWAA